MTSSADITPLLDIMARLRDPESGCPWDRVQDFASIAPYTVEEAHEVADAIARGHMADLQDELGDLLFQVVFHARMAQEAGFFDFAAVLSGIVDKMIRRHPHVFGEEQNNNLDIDSQSVAWEAQKARERKQVDGAGSLLDSVTRGLSGMRQAAKMQKKVAEVGFDWPGPLPVLEKIREEIDELAQEIHAGHKDAMQEELGDVLFTCVNLARHLDLDPDSALRRANVKFEERFRRMETMAAARDGGDGGLESLSADALEELWEQAKSGSKREPIESLP